MSSNITFRGKLAYEEPDAIEEAMDQVRELLAEEDDDLRETLEEDWEGCFKTKGNQLHVELVLSGPSEWWFVLESVVETLTAAAADGFIDAAMEGASGKTRYHAGGDEEELDE